MIKLTRFGIITSTIVLLIFLSCASDISIKEKHIPAKEKPKHLNVMICSDLSNRLTKYEKALDDIELISRFLDIYPKKIYYSNGRKKGQEDIISTIILNDKNIKDYELNTNHLQIDLSSSESMNMFKRISFIKDSINGYTKAKQNFKREIQKMYELAKEKPQGADLYNLFNQKLDSIYIKKKGYRNILLLFTDGYIEYGLEYKKDNKSYFLSQNLIDSFRKEYKKSNATDIESFFENNNYGIKPLKNPELENLEVVAFEFYDRSLTSNSQNSTQIPTDYEIMKLFWEDWMTKSKVKSFKSYKFSSIENFETRLLNFIENN